jgi:hypothetical protein
VVTLVAKVIPQLKIILDFGGSGTKVVASLDDGNPIYFLMPPHCAEISPTQCTEADFNENSVWFRCDESCYAVGLLASANSGKSIEVKPLKVESAPIKTLAAVVIAARKLGAEKRVLLTLSIVLPSGEAQQNAIYKEDVEALLNKKIVSPWGVFQAKIKLFKADFEGEGILLYHQHITRRTTQNVLVLMLGYRNASFIATVGSLVASTNCSDIGFHSFLQKIVSLTAGYSIEQLLLPVTRYGANKLDSALIPVLRFSPGSPHREKELADLKSAIEKAEEYYTKLIMVWLREFLTVEVDEIVLAGGSAEYIGQHLAEKLAETIVPSMYVICVYQDKFLPADISGIKNGERFLDIYGIWHQINSA